MSSGVSTTSAEATLDALADPVIVCGIGGRLEYVNEAASRLLGEPAEALTGRAADSIVPARLREVEGTPFFDWMARHYEEVGRPVRAALLRSDGVEIHRTFRVSTTTVEGRGKAIVVVLRPPSDQGIVEADPLGLDAANPTAERTYRAVFDSVPVGIMHFDTRGRVTDCNDVFVRQMGSTRTQLTGLDLLTLPNEAVTAAVREALEGRNGHFEGPYRSVTGGKTSLYRALLSPIFRDGRVEGGVGISEDITGRRALEERLAQGERMASLGRLAAGVAHEINNPLAYVRTSLEIARREIERLRDVAEAARLELLLDAIGSADEGVERVRVIASDLKTFSRGDEGSWVPVDLARVAESAINLVHNELRHRAELVREIAPVPPVMGSDTRFVQVLVNLLMNAAQAIPEEGDAREQRVTLRIGEVRPGRVFIEVEDTGEGIDPELVPHVFEPFWTSKPKGVGTGLGLSICHGIVTAAGGEIRVTRTAPGRGTVFRIELPSADPTQPREEPRRPRPPRPTPSRRHRILVVDDESELGRSLRVALTERYDVVVSTNGPDALERLVAGPRFDLVLCDLMMPEMSGMELYEAALARRPEQAARFVFMTGGAFTERARAFLSEHRVPRLHKPFGLEELEAMIARDEVSTEVALPPDERA